MFRLLFALGLSTLLGACASAPGPATPATDVTAAEPATPETPTAEPTPPPERAFPEESVYPLLVAEFALRRRAYDLALERYLEQSDSLRDRGVSAHTTHIAQVMQREAEALQAVQLWVELEPDNLEANETLATLLVRAGRTPEALPHLATVARGGEAANFPILLSRFPELSAAQQNQLVEELDALSSEFPESKSILLTRALAFDELERSEDALAVLERLFELEPDQYQGLLLEAKLKLERGDRRPFDHIEEVLEADPENNRLRLQYARLLTREDMEAARKQFEILSAQSPRDGDLLFSLALINHEVGDDLAARAYLRQLLDLGQRTDEAHYYMGRIAEQSGSLREALESYMAVSDARSADFYSAKGRVGRILLDSGQTEESHAFFTALREEHPEHRERLYALEAELLLGADYPDRSLALLNEALQELPESTSLRYSRSMIGEKQGDLELMERDLRDILAREPDNATALNALGYSLANRTERFDEAEKLIARALVLAPNEPAILDSMGWVLYKQGRLDEALPYLQRAYDAFPDPEVAAHLGEVLWVSGANERAREIWREALARDPEHTVLVSTIRRFDVSMLQAAP